MQVTVSRSPSAPSLRERGFYFRTATWLVGLVAVMIMLTISCNAGEDTEGAAVNNGEQSPDPVSLARIRQGVMVGGECTFNEDISQYQATYFPPSEDCLQAVRIGPIDRDELEQMKRDVPLFWENSHPYQQVLVGEWIDGKCEFTNPGIRAFLAVFEIVSTDLTKCLMTIEVGPVTEKQIEEIQRLGGESESSTAVPAPSVAVPSQ